MPFEISFLLLWNRRSAFLQYCILLFQKSECFDSPSDMTGKSWHVPTVQVDMYPVMYNVPTCHRHRSCLVAPLALCLRPPEKLFPKSRKNRYMEFILSKKIWNRFFRAWKSVCHAGGRATPPCHVPDPRDSWQQRTLWFSHVIVSRAANPALQWYLKVGFC